MMSTTCISCRFYSPCSVIGKLCDILNNNYHCYEENPIYFIKKRYKND